MHRDCSAAGAFCMDSSRGFQVALRWHRDDSEARRKARAMFEHSLMSFVTTTSTSSSTKWLEAQAAESGCQVVHSQAQRLSLVTPAAQLQAAARGQSAGTSEILQSPSHFGLWFVLLAILHSLPRPQISNSARKTQVVKNSTISQESRNAISKCKK
eukprot:1474345-Rhodomonas_salina.1